MYGRQRLGDDDGAVRLLVVLEDGDERPPDREAGAVQRVQEPRLRPGLRAVAQARAAGLEVLAVRARRDLAVRLLPRQPDLDVVGLGGGEAHVAGRQHDHAVRQAEPLQHLLGVARPCPRARPSTTRRS